MSSIKKCKIEHKGSKWTFEGPCADQLARGFERIFQASKSLRREISAVACIHNESGRVDKLEVDTIGDATSTRLRSTRVCSTGHSQISLHTHPISGTAKFSRSDALTVTDRLNEDVDDGSCVVGRGKAACLVKAELAY